MEELKGLEQQKNHSGGSVSSYITGFLLSITLTLAAYIPVSIHFHSHHQIFSHELLIPMVLFFAVVQLIVQVIFFLHLGQESKPRWNLAFFISTIGIVLLVVLASIWIMYHLNYNMTPEQMFKFTQNESGF